MMSRAQVAHHYNPSTQWVEAQGSPILASLGHSETMPQNKTTKHGVTFVTQLLEGADKRIWHTKSLLAIKVIFSQGW